MQACGRRRVDPWGGRGNRHQLWRQFIRADRPRELLAESPHSLLIVDAAKVPNPNSTRATQYDIINRRLRSS